MNKKVMLLGSLFFVLVIGGYFVYRAISVDVSREPASTQDLVFEVNGKKYEAAKSDLLGLYKWKDAKAGCDRLITDDDDNKQDWFLPSKEELNAMYEQLHKKGVGGFSCCTGYWNSYEIDENTAGFQYFYDIGPQKDCYGKNCIKHVRCARFLTI